MTEPRIIFNGHAYYCNSLTLTGANFDFLASIKTSSFIPKCMNLLSMSLAKRISERSSLTEAQLESLALYQKVRAGEISLKEAANSRSGRPVTVGAYYRTVDQAKRNVRSSILTVVTGLWLGYIRVEDVRRLFELVGRGAVELSEEEADQFMGVLNALVERIVT